MDGTPQPPNQPARPVLGRVREVEWLSLLPSLRILGAVHAGLRPERLAIAFLLLLTVVAAGRVWDGFAEPTAPPEGLLAGPLREAALVSDLDSVRAVVLPELPAAERTAAATASLEELQAMVVAAAHRSSPTEGSAARFASLVRMIDAARPRQPFEALHEAVRTELYRAAEGVLLLHPADAIQGISALAVDIPRACWRAAPWFAACFGLVCLVAVGCGGGVLCRLNAGDLCAHAWTVAQARQFINPRLSSLVAAPLFAAVLVGVLLLPALVLGWLLGIPVLNIAAALLLPLALGTAMLAGIVAAAATIGCALLAPAVACDGCDAVESLQRSGAYILARPLHFLWGAILSVLALTLALLAADFVVAWSWGAVIAAMKAAGAEQLAGSAGALRFLEPRGAGIALVLGPTDAVAASLLDLWRTLLGLAIGAVVVSVGFACSTRTYVLLRASADGQEWSDMWMDGDDQAAGVRTTQDRP